VRRSGVSKTKIEAAKFRVRKGEKVHLKKRPTKTKPAYASEADYRDLLEKHIGELSEQQGLLYAGGRHAVLLIVQAMDAAGKDGIIKHVMSGINPQGCQVFSFKQPSAEELKHDFLWRTNRCLPERGRIGIFNRSYYEEVLIVRVHPEMLQAQGLPGEHLNDQGFWDGRYRSIAEMEAHLHRNGTRIVKIFLHLSKEEQKKRFLARIDTPEKNWKFSPADVAERKLWSHYRKAYEACLSETSTDDSPWYVVPADDKKNARLIVSEILLETLRDLKMKYPEVDKNRVKELKFIRTQL
jgi:PPK2 family polyphosphate:nucleotide phosphotransferase